MKIHNSEVGIFSDPHYGVHRNSETWHKIALAHAKWAAEQFRKRGIKDIIIPGDIFHDRNDIAVNTLQAVTTIMECFKDFNVIITVGNHDAFHRDKSDVTSISILKGWPNITIVDVLVVYEAHGRKIAFCPWGQDIDQVPKCDLIVGHFEINSFKMNSYKICTNGLKTTDLTDRAPLTISGHFHHKEERHYKDRTILYVGCAYQMDWGDFDTKKGLYVLDLETLQYEFIENTVSPQYFKVKYSEIVNGLYTTETLRSTITGNIIKFIIDVQLDPAATDVIIRKLVSIKPVEFTIEYDYVQLTKIDQAKAAQTDFNISVENSIAEYIDLLEIGNKDKVRTYVTELYHKVSNAS